MLLKACKEVTIRCSRNNLLTIIYYVSQRLFAFIVEINYFMIVGDQIIDALLQHCDFISIESPYVVRELCHQAILLGYQQELFYAIENYLTQKVKQLVQNSHKQSSQVLDSLLNFITYLHENIQTLSDCLSFLTHFMMKEGLQSFQRLIQKALGNAIISNERFYQNLFSNYFQKIQQYRKSPHPDLAQQLLDIMIFLNQENLLNQNFNLNFTQSFKSHFQNVQANLSPTLQGYLSLKQAIQKQMEIYQTLPKSLQQQNKQTLKQFLQSHGNSICQMMIKLLQGQQYQEVAYILGFYQAASQRCFVKHIREHLLMKYRSQIKGCLDPLFFATLVRIKKELRSFRIFANPYLANILDAILQEIINQTAQNYYAIVSSMHSIFKMQEEAIISDDDIIEILQCINSKDIFSRLLKQRICKTFFFNEDTKLFIMHYLNLFNKYEEKTGTTIFQENKALLMAVEEIKLLDWNSIGGNIRIFSKIWPQIGVKNVELPKKMLKIRKEFIAKYKDRHSNHTLIFLDSFSTITLGFTRKNAKYTAHLPIIHASILLFLQEGISNHTTLQNKFKSDIISRPLQQLIACKLVKKTDHKLELSVPQMEEIKIESQIEFGHVEKWTVGERGIAMEAAVLKEIKSSSLNREELMERMQKSFSLCRIQSKQLDQTLTKLQSKDYITKDNSTTPPTYHYST